MYLKEEIKFSVNYPADDVFNGIYIILSSGPLKMDIKSMSQKKGYILAETRWSFTWHFFFNLFDTEEISIMVVPGIKKNSSEIIITSSSKNSIVSKNKYNLRRLRNTILQRFGN